MDFMYSSEASVCANFSAKRSPRLFRDKIRHLIPILGMLSLSVFRRASFHLRESLRVLWAQMSWTREAVCLSCKSLH